VAKFTKEHRQKLGAARAKAWARMSPEERQAAIDKRSAAAKRNTQIRLIKAGAMRGSMAIPSFIDPDFDEGL
jgi:hypothetical protein